MFSNNANNDNEGWIDSRIRRPRLIRQSRRHCSYCSDPNHIISFCNHESLYQFELELMEKKQCINTFHRNESLRAKINFFETIVFNSLNSVTANFKNKVKAFATSKCGSFANKIYNEHIKDISKYIWYDELETERIREGDLNAIRTLLSMNLMMEEREAIIGSNGDILGWIDHSPDLSVLSNLILNNLNGIRNINILHSTPEKKYAITTIKYCKKDENMCKDCSICYEEKKQYNFVKLNCGHEFCGICVKTIIDKNDKPSCAFCRTDIKTIDVYDNIENKQLLMNYKK